MRIIHTADWHLGQHFMGKSREAEHQAFLDWLLKFIKEHRIDALIVAGDIFDTGTPPSYARQMFNRFVGDSKDAECQLLLLGGNHDSVAMLEESADLLRRLGVDLVAKPADDPLNQVVRLQGASSEAPGALVCAIPFLRARYITKSVAGQDGDTKQQQLQAAIAEHYQAVFNAAEKLRADNQWDCPIIATGHLTAVGASRSDSVRDIYIGALEAFPASAFPPADYIALGHIHGAQKVAGNEKIRYSGSPIPLSFDESGHGLQKSIVQLTTGEGSAIDFEITNVPEFRTLHTIRGTLESIEKQLADLLSEHKPASDFTTWLEVIVSTQDYLDDLQQRVAAMVEGHDIEVLLLRRERKHRSATLEAAQKQTLNELSVHDIFDHRLDEAFAGIAASAEDESTQTRNRETQTRLKALYSQVVSEVQGGDAK